MNLLSVYPPHPPPLLSPLSPSPLWLRAVFGGLLINKIHRPRFLFLIGQVESLPHSGAGDATSSRILHVRLVLFLIESLAVGQREKAGFATSRECRTDRGALDTKHFPSREESGAQEQPLSLSLSRCLSPSLTHIRAL